MFASREDAGRKLADHLISQNVHADLVLGLPRGGVVVAAEVARVLRLPLDVLIVRKVGHPRQREFAVGALAENGVVLLDEAAIQTHAVERADLDAIVAEEQARLREYEVKFHFETIPPLAGQAGIGALPRRRYGGEALAGLAVLLVDDGLATGATTEAAVMSARSRHARRVIVAAPVASTNAVERLARVADAVCVLQVDRDFEAVGAYYDVFAQTTDEEVLGLLADRARETTR